MKRILFLGSKSIGLSLLRAVVALAPGSVCAVVTLDDRGDNRSELESIERVASDCGLPLRVARNRAHAEGLVRAEMPHLCLVAGWYWLFSPEVLSSVPEGFIGIHNSVLPKYRGGSPLVWALINGETEVGVSFFSLRQGIDDGPVWLQATIPVGPEEYVGEVLQRLETETIRVFHDGFPRILSGRLTPHEQEHAKATYCAQRTPEDGEIDWSRRASSVFDFIRAQSRPYPGAFTFLEQQKLMVFRASPVTHRYDGTPGQVARRDGDGVVVVCGEGSALRLDEVDVGVGPIGAGRAVNSIGMRFPRYPRRSVPETVDRRG
jgi:methionyl-tRNA formyltransferase